jgi:hypothetical protein
MGHVTFSVKPANATVRYRRAGEESQIADISKILNLQPGPYEFTAEAEGFDSQTQPLEIKAEVTTPFAVTLQKPVIKPPETFVDPNSCVMEDKWCTGKTKGAMIAIQTRHAKNTLFFLKNNVKKMVWRVSLDKENYITYTLDSKGLSIGKVIAGNKASSKYVGDMSGTGTASNAYAARIQLLSNGVRVSKQDETEVDKTSDDQHDWRRATISVKGDATFTVWLDQ